VQRHLGYMVTVVLQCARALTRKTYTALHQGIQLVEARYFTAGTINNTLFFTITIDLSVNPLI
jgi:hypothetical protein